VASSTEICNLALSHLGVGKEIANLDTEQSQEASACRRFYETARDACLRDFSWPFAMRYDELALVEEDPNDEWLFSYRYPTNCMRILKILSGTRNDTRQTRVPYEIAQDDQGRLLFTDQENAEIRYIYKETDPDKYTPDFILALSYRLAYYIAPRLTAGDPFSRGPASLEAYQIELSRAAANAVNEGQVEEEVNSELQRARE
jgi:hypothetical protein